MFHRRFLLPLTILGAGAGMLSSCARAPQSAKTAAIYDRQGHQLPDDQASSDQVDWQTLTPSDPHYLDWNGVGSITPGCTATLLAKPASGAAGPAYLITAGHCFIYPYDDPDKALVDQPTSQSVQLGKYVRGNGAPEPVRLSVDKILYATMNGSDVSLLQVADVSYADLVARGVRPLALSQAEPVLGEGIVIPQEPLEGVSRPGLRLASCSVGPSADLREEPFHSFGAFRNHCSSVGGTSGAPVVSKRSGQIIGVLTTGTRELTTGQPDCGDSRPCEVQKDGSGITFPGENYAQHVFQYARCFDQSGTFDLKTPGCTLVSP